MTILLAGASGFIGSHVKTRLESLGHEVVPLRRGLPAAIEGTPEAIINCAGELTDESKMVAANITLVDTLLDLAAKWRIDKVIHLGSSAETGPTNLPRSEDLPCLPSTHYERTKLHATHSVVEFAERENRDACVIRPFSIYGPCETPRKLIPQLYDALLSHRVFELFPGAHDWLYVDDFVDGVVAVLNAPREVTKGQIINLGSGHSTGNTEVMETFQSVADEMKLGLTLKWRFNAKRFHTYDVFNWQADIAKAKRLLNWRPKTSLREGLRRYIDWRWFEEDRG